MPNKYDKCHILCDSTCDREERVKIKILYFAHLKSLTRQEEEILEIPSHSTLLNLHSLLKQKYTDFLDSKHLAIAVNETYAHSKTLLKEGDTVCFIPPVAGG